MKKVKGITLLETVIAMTITTIVLGMASVFYLSLSKSMINFQSTQQEVATYQQLFFLFKDDWDKSSLILRNENNIVMQGSKNFNYTFEDRFIVRQQNETVTDTFYIQVIAYETYFNRDAILENTFPIEKISVQLKSEKCEFQFDLKKEYPSAFYINLEDNGY